MAKHLSFTAARYTVAWIQGMQELGARLAHYSCYPSKCLQSRTQTHAHECAHKHTHTYPPTHAHARTHTPFRPPPSSSTVPHPKLLLTSTARTCSMHWTNPSAAVQSIQQMLEKSSTRVCHCTIAPRCRTQKAVHDACCPHCRVRGNQQRLPWTSRAFRGRRALKAPW